MATYLVTGGAGFIGSNVVAELCRRGEHVRVLDDLSGGRRENLDGMGARVELIEGDVCDPAVAARGVLGTDYVVHLAAVPSVERSVKAPHDSHRVNVLGTLTLLEAARGAGVRRLVYAGSSSAYGDSLEQPKRETMLPRPLSPYAATKLAGEAYAQAWHACFGLPTVVLRYFNVYGPRQDPSSPYAAVIPRFARAALSGAAPTVYGDGRQTRDFCFVDDAARATLQACVAPLAEGRTINVGCGKSVSVLEVIDALGRLVGRPLRPLHEPERRGDIRDSLADVGRARELLDYAPRVSLAEGLERTLAWMRRGGP
jgi:UDP-N-acetylglucosamine/UDP-N-acetyl-alpha-D-glucosaminouronate 4-epimerase